jgi:hypothetical protein
MRVLFFLLYSLSVFSNDLDIPWPQENAVVYHAQKKMFIFKTVDIIGMNKNIAFSKAALNSGYILTLSIPIANFKTDEPERDKEVAGILKINENQFLTFTSKKLSSQDLQMLKVGKLETIAGLLQIGLKKFDVLFQMSLDGEYIKGEFSSTFSYFQIEPPSVGFGVVAKARDYIKLLVRIRVIDL